jgi:iron complex outermembrane recepter protein
MSKKVSIAASALALAVSSAFAQSETTGATSSLYQLATLDPVVVTASRFEEPLFDVPAFKQVITKEEIRDSGAVSLTEAIGKLGNINTFSAAGGQLGILTTIDLRGFGASARDNTLILVDGLRVSPVDSGSIRWETIPLGIVERIEILHGGGSVQYGDKAVGGVINIITRRMGRPTALAEISVGSFGSKLARGSVVTSSDTSSSLSFDVDAARTDGWRQNSQASQGALRARYDYQRKVGEELFFEALYAGQSYGMPGGVIGEVNAGDRRAAKWNNVRDKTVTNSSRGVMGLSKDIDSGVQLRAEISYGDSKQTVYTPFLSAKKSIYSKRSLDFTPRLKRSWNDRNESVVGYDYQQASASGTPDTTDRQTAKLTNQAVYGMHRYDISKDLELMLGLRRQVQKAEARDLFGLTSDISAERQQRASASDLALSQIFGEGSLNRIYVRINRSYRFPNTDEFWGFNPRNNFAREFNGILKPQFSKTYEVGGSWEASRATKFEGSVYRMITSDEIRYDLDSGINFNAPEISRKGLAVGVTHRLSPRVLAHGAFALQKAEYNAQPFEGKEVPLVPRAMASAQLSYRYSGRTSVNASGRFVSSQYYMDDNQNERRKMPDYLVFDVGLRHELGQFMFDFSVRNFFDEKYATFGGYNTFITLPGGSTSDYYYYPGDPRSFWLTVSYRR